MVELDELYKGTQASGPKTQGKTKRKRQPFCHGYKTARTTVSVNTIVSSIRQNVHMHCTGPCRTKTKHARNEACMQVLCTCMVYVCVSEKGEHAKYVGYISPIFLFRAELATRTYTCQSTTCTVHTCHTHTTHDTHTTGAHAPTDTCCRNATHNAHARHATQVHTRQQKHAAA